MFREREKSNTSGSSLVDDMNSFKSLKPASATQIIGKTATTVIIRQKKMMNPYPTRTDAECIS